MATKTNNSKQDKQYVVIDNDGDVLAFGTMDEVIESLNEYNDGYHDDDELTFEQWINECTVYELTNAKKLKYTPAKYTF